MIKNVVSTALSVDERLLVKKNSISAGTGKKRVCIVTGTHGDELEGQYICFRLAQLLSQNEHLLDGTVEIYPSLNPLGMDSIIRGIPGFDLDMNRIFPGDPEGTMAENTAYAIIEDLKGADMVIDIHSSNIYLREVLQARINVQTADNLIPYAELLNLDFIWVHEAATVLKSTLAHSLNSVGTPCIVVEMGVGMRINQKLGNRLVTGILNLLHHLGLWKEEITPEAIHQPILSREQDVTFINAPSSGIFFTDEKNNHTVEIGEEIGNIVSPLTGEVLHRILSPIHGYLFTIRAYPIVYEGSLIARIHKL